jgi:UDP-N-acetylglucosamine 2-epimerase (non-hydrolysing)
MRVPNVTLRDTTERPETVECGSNVVSGSDPWRIRECARYAISRSGTWKPPVEYLTPCVSDTVVNILLGNHTP